MAMQGLGKPVNMSDVEMSRLNFPMNASDMNDRVIDLAIEVLTISP